MGKEPDKEFKELTLMKSVDNAMIIMVVSPTKASPATAIATMVTAIPTVTMTKDAATTAAVSVGAAAATGTMMEAAVQASAGL